MKTKFNSENGLPLNKLLKFHVMNVIIRSVFEEDGKLYPQLFLDDTLHKLKKYYSTKKLVLQKELMLIKQVCQKNVNFVIIGISADVGFKFEPHVSNGCHDLLTMAYELENIAILSANRATFKCTLWGISRNEGLRLNNSVLEDKGSKNRSKSQANIDHKSSSLSLL